jgi:hypothetical protein
MEANGFIRSSAALKAHFSSDHPEGAHPVKTHHHYAHVEDIALLSLVEENITWTSTGHPRVLWDAVERGMTSKGFVHSLSGLKQHVSKLNQGGVTHGAY